MEPFLSTLPPYVHDYLNRHPPTDVFNVLRELICFAVLYSNDREKILTLNKELITKGAADGNIIVQSPFPQRSMTTVVTATTPMTATTTATTTPEPIPSMSEKMPIVAKEESRTIGTATPASSTSSSLRSTNDTPPPTTKPSVPYTFPEWWGHHDEPESLPIAKKTDDKQVKAARRETVSTWIPWDEPTTSADKKMQRTMSSASCKPIPDLRPYLERSHTVTGSSQPKSTTLRRSATNSPASTTSRLSKTPVSARSSKTPIISNRASLPPTTRATITPTTRTTTPSPIKTTAVARASKTPLTATPTRTSKTPSSTASSSPSSTSPPLSRTQSAFRPGLTATVRARQEHAKAKEREMEEQKLKAAQLNGVNLRLKQQARSSIDWAAIKQERRRTMPIMKPSS